VRAEVASVELEPPPRGPSDAKLPHRDSMSRRGTGVSGPGVR
jgi:hypothetical protein